MCSGKVRREHNGTAMDLDNFKNKQTQAAAWGNNAEQYAANLHEGSGIMMPLIAAYGEMARELVKGSPQILDIASGTGEPGISLARQYPNGSVTMTDLAEGMIAGAKGRASRLSITNASFDVADAEDLSQFEDATFDLVTCNCGLMFMPNYERALEEFRRVLKPDGVALMSDKLRAINHGHGAQYLYRPLPAGANVAWGLPEHTQFISIMMDMQRAIAPNDSFFADPNILGSREKLLHAVERAGFSNVTCREVNVPVHAPGDKIRPVLLQNALIAELLGRLIERGETDVADRAHAAILDAAAKKGFLQEDGSIQCPTNIALFVTARP